MIGEFGDVAARHGSALPGLGDFAAALEETGREIMLPNGRMLVLHDSDEDSDADAGLVWLLDTVRDGTVRLRHRETGEVREMTEREWDAYGTALDIASAS